MENPRRRQGQAPHANSWEVWPRRGNMLGIVVAYNKEEALRKAVEQYKVEIGQFTLMKLR